MSQAVQKLSFFQRLRSVLPSFRSQSQLLSQFTSDSWLYKGWDMPSASGQMVNQNTVLGIPAFYRGVQVISETIASLKIEVEELQTDGNKEKKPAHVLAKLVNDPSPRYNKFDFWATLIAYGVVRGNGYAFINRNRGTGRATELRLLSPDDVEPYLNNDGELRYKVFGDSGMKIVEYDQILHVKGLDLSEDHIKALSPISIFKNSLGLPLAMQDWAGKTYKDGSPLQGLLSTELNMSPQQIKVATKQWKEQLSRGSTPILPGGLKYQSITLSPEDAEFIDGYKLTVEDVSRILGVPLPFLSSLDRATFSNIEELGRWFVTYTIRPWIKRIEAEVNRKLPFEREKGKTRIRWNMESLLRGSTEAQSQFLQSMVLNGIMSRNEARQYLGLNTKEGLDEMPLPVQFQQQTTPSDEEE